MAKSDTFENDLLKLIFNGVTIEGIADNDATGALTSLYLALHTADPGEAGVQNTSETTYTGYARKAVARTTGGFTVTNNQAALAAAQDFGEITAGAGSLTHFSVGVASSGATKILYRGALSAPITIAAGTIPRLGTGTVITEN